MPLEPSFQRILIINIFGIGDVLFTTPLIQAIKRNNPGAFIGYLANCRTAPVLQASPRVAKIFIYDRDEFVALARRSRLEYWKKILKLGRDIQREKFDLVLDLSFTPFMGLLTKLAGIRRRAGFNYKKRGRFLTEKIPLAGYEEKHVVEYYFDLLKMVQTPGTELRIGQQEMEIFVGPENRQWADEWLARHNISQTDSLVAVVPGGGASWGKTAFYKRWPAGNYAKLADKMIENCGAKIILMGDKNEKDLCRSVAGNMRHEALDVCGETSILQFAALLKRCRAAVVNDGGPLHIAVAAGTKTVSIFGPVDERVYGPYPPDGHLVVKKDLPCQPCYRRFRMSDCEHVSCLKELGVDKVLEAVESILKIQ